MTGPVTSPPRPPAVLRMTPGRWATLAIGVPIALVLIGWSAFSLVAGIGGASFPVSATIPVQNGRVVASTGGGDITVHQGHVSDGAARLTGTVEYSLVRPRFTVSGSGVSLHCRLPTGNCGLNATLDVPSHTAVDLSTGGGNMQVSGIQGNVTLDSGFPFSFLSLGQHRRRRHHRAPGPRQRQRGPADRHGRVQPGPPEVHGERQRRQPALPPAHR